MQVIYGTTTWTRFVGLNIEFEETIFKFHGQNVVSSNRKLCILKFSFKKADLIFLMQYIPLSFKRGLFSMNFKHECISENCYEYSAFSKLFQKGVAFTNCWIKIHILEQIRGVGRLWSQWHENRGGLEFEQDPAEG